MTVGTVFEKVNQREIENLEGEVRCAKDDAQKWKTNSSELRLKIESLKGEISAYSEIIDKLIERLGE